MTSTKCTRILSLVLLPLTMGSVALSNPGSEPSDHPLKVVVADRLAAALPGMVRLQGRLQDKLERCVDNRLLVQDPETFIAPYRDKTESGSSDWRCEYYGKWFTALALADAYRTDPALAAVRDRSTDELMKTAAPDGYLGTRQPADRTKGWDVWGCKYAMLGLLADYDRTGDPAVLRAAAREADVLIDEMGPGKANPADIGEWNGLPACSVLEPVVLLYQRSGDSKYLAFAQHIVTSWSKPSKRLPNGGMRLIEDALAHKRPSKMCAPKAYEMMSCFEGLCELYRATGRTEYLAAPVALVDSVQKYECGLVGCGTSGELWCDGAHHQTGVIGTPMETCVTATWMKLNYQLLRLTGDPGYADELERNLYNGLLGAMTPKGDWWAYFSGQMGVRVPSYVQHADCGTSCCVLNGPRGLMITPAWSVMQRADGPVINLLAPTRALMKTPGGQAVTLDLQGDYPVSDGADVRLTVEKPELFTLAVRIPSWSQRTLLTINGSPVDAQPGTYARLHRTWSTGDTVSVHCDMRGRLVRAPDGNGEVAVVRGPVVLSLDNRLAPPSDGSTAVTAADDTVTLTPNNSAAAKVNAWMAFDVSVTVDGQPRLLTFCDYADAGNAFSQVNIFRSWLPQPLDLRKMYDTRQSWRTLSHAAHWTDVPVSIDDRAGDLALAANGAVATSDSEYAKEPGCTARVNDGVIATADDFANRWHSSIGSPHPHWVQIKLPRPATIGSVIINFADPQDAAVDFSCVALVDGKEVSVARTTENRESRAFTAHFTPVVTDTLRIVIDRSASAGFPNAAQISEVQLYSPRP